MMKENEQTNSGIFRDVVFTDERFRATSVFEELLRAFRENVPVGRHIRHFRIYSDSFVASDAVTWFLKQLNSTNVQLFVAPPNRDQVVRILNMFYQPWIRLFTDVRGIEFDRLKPHFLDNRRIFRLNENFSLIQISEPDGNLSLLGDRHNRSVCEPVCKSSKSSVCEIEALQLSCENRTPAGRRLTLHQKSSSESSLTAVERCSSSGDTVRYSCLELQPVRLFDDSDSGHLDRFLPAPDTSANSLTNDKIFVDTSAQLTHRESISRNNCNSLSSEIMCDSSVARNVILVNDSSVARNGSLVNDSSVARNGSLVNDSSVARNGSLVNDSSVSRNGSSLVNDSSVARNGSLVNDSSVARNGSLVNDSSVARNGSLVNGSSVARNGSSLVKSKVDSKNMTHDKQMLCTTCRDVVIQRFKELFGCEDVLDVFDVSSIDFTHVHSNVSTITVSSPTTGNGTRDTLYAIDLFKVICDYCQTWSVPLFSYQSSTIIIRIVEYLANEACHTSSVTNENNELLAESVSKVEQSLKKQSAYQVNLKLGNKDTLDNSMRKLKLSKEYHSETSEECLKGSSVGFFPPVFPSVEASAKCDLVTSGNARTGFTLPYFPPVSSSLRDAEQMFGGLELAYLADSDGDCMVDKSFSSSSNWQSLVESVEFQQNACVQSQSSSEIDSIVGRLLSRDCVMPRPDVGLELAPTDYRKKTISMKRSSRHVLADISPSKLTDTLQLCCLLLSPCQRTKMLQFFEFLNRVITNRHLVLDNLRTTRQVVLEAVSKHIVAYDVSNPLSPLISSGIVDFMLDHYQKILQIPNGIEFSIHCAVRGSTSIHRTSVLKKLQNNADSQKQPADTSGVNTSSNLSYCEQVSREEYEEQRRNIAHDALLKLLDSIVDDPLMSPKSKSRRLQQYQISYPELYARRFPAGQLSLDSSNQFTRPSKQPLLKKSLTKLRSLRV